jgi:dihydroorotate dehydrogenase (fumarate)
MDLSTTYLGFHLPHPFMPGASPLVDDLDMVRRLEDAGAAAIVMHSLFEEQIVAEQLAAFSHTETHADTFAEALSYFPDTNVFALGPAEYLDRIRQIKEAVSVPVIASLNGSSLGGWLKFAQQMQQAGADALELNVYSIATDLHDTAQDVEGQVLSMLRAVKERVHIPVAVKLSPFCSAFGHFAHQLDEAGADGLVIFNRFYQPDIDVEELVVEHQIHLSDSRELLLRLRWLAILSGRVQASLAVTGGVHTPLDAIKAIMCGAQAVQMVSALLRHGPEHLRVVREWIATWLEEHEYESLAQMQGSMSLIHCPDPQAYERANYLEMLQSWR